MRASRLKEGLKSLLFGDSECAFGDSECACAPRGLQKARRGLDEKPAGRDAIGDSETRRGGRGRRLWRGATGRVGSSAPPLNIAWETA